jgi:hypothetical protein
MILQLYDIAQIVHDTHCRYCHHIGDKTQVLWADAPEWQKISTVMGVNAVLDNPDITPEQLHAKWVETRAEYGWVYAPLKNVERKEHPCMVDYSKLDVNQKQKDWMFHAVVRACLKFNEGSV